MAEGLETAWEIGGGSPAAGRLRVEEVRLLFPGLEVEDLIGAGGMGAVYRARQKSLDRVVALKLLPPATGDDGRFADRFEREARALARLNHPNIVAVYEYGRVDGLPYFIMEHVDGVNLRQLQRSGRVSAREALQIIPQICDALQYAHDEGVVHRDIKPENVLVDRKGRVKIADFGLARILELEGESMRLTGEGQVMGTPHYMAPEQVEHPLEVDHRADIYSLGVVFYELLTGDLPLGRFEAPSRKVRVDVRLDEVVLRALENDPDRRYQQASEVKTRVEAIADGRAPVSETDEAGSTASGSAPGNPARRGERLVYWAGFPVVMDRPGDREVSWEGAISFIGVVMLSVAAGLFVVKTASGQEHFSLPLAFLGAIGVVGYGLRRALETPLPEGAAGDARRARGPSKWALCAGVMLWVVGGHFALAQLRSPSLWRIVPELDRQFQAGREFRYGPVIEREFTELIDFDKGITGELPLPERPRQLFEGLSEALVWMQENGFDASASTGELELLDMRIVGLSGADWGGLSAADLAQKVSLSAGRAASIPVEGAVLPVTYGFRTREGSVGMLQVTAWETNRPGLQVRYKTLANPALAGGR